MAKENTIYYYDGSSARPIRVRVLFYESTLQLYDDTSNNFIKGFPLASTTHNQVNDIYYLYFDHQGLTYLQFSASHPIANTLLQSLAPSKSAWEQRLMRQKIVVLLFLLAGLAIGCYFGILYLTSFLGTKIISVDQEIRIGNRLKEIRLQQERMAGTEIDTTGTKQLQAFASKLHLSTQYPIRLTLLKSKQVNAYALPGGQIVVYSGILKKIKTPEALAALLAHESTHINERHSLKSLLRNAASSIIVSILFSDATGISGALVSNAETLNGLRYSRSLETEADQKGMDLMLVNKISLEGMRQLMQALKEEGDIPSGMYFLSTHPLTKKRVKEVNRYIKEHPQKEILRTDLQLLFDNLQQSSISK